METYKQIQNFPNYEVSDLGNIRNIKTGRILSKASDQKGYLLVSLRDKEKTQTKRVARLVAQAFIPNPEDKSQVNHIDGNRQNNIVSNLEWNTGSENMVHAYQKLKRKGSQTGKQYGNSPFSKKIVQISLNGKEIKVWDSMREAAEFFGIKRQTIASCIRGKSKTAAKHKWKFYE